MLNGMIDSREGFDLACEVETLVKIILVSWDSEGVNLTREVREEKFDAFVAELESQNCSNIYWEVIDYV